MLNKSQVKDLASKSLYFFAKSVVGFNEFTAGLHKELCDFIQDTDHKRKLLLIPRGHFKSSSCTIAYSTWRAIQDPNIRILIVSNTATNAERFLREIRAIFFQNELFRNLWPEFCPEMSQVRLKDTETELCIPRTKNYGESTFTAIGVGGKATSKHFDLIIKDDLIDESINYDGTMMDDIIQWHMYSEGLFNKPSEGEDIIIGTRYHFNDIYQHILDNELQYKQYIRSSIEDGKPIFPERFSMDTLAMIKAKQGPVVFANQYLNSPIDEDAAKFRLEHLQYIEPTKIPRGLLRFMMTDTIGDKQGKDYFATTVWGVDPKVDSLGLNDIYLLDIICGRLDIESAVRGVIGMYFRNRPIAYGIERTGQSTFGLHIQNELRYKAQYVNYEDLSPRGRQKEARIWGLLPYAINRKIFVNAMLLGSPAFQEFEYEWLRFPKVKRDDVLDSSAYLLDFIEQYRHSFDYGDEEYEEESDYVGRSSTGY